MPKENFLRMKFKELSEYCDLSMTCPNVSLMDNGETVKVMHEYNMIKAYDGKDWHYELQRRNNNNYMR